MRVWASRWELRWARCLELSPAIWACGLPWASPSDWRSGFGRAAKNRDARNVRRYIGRTEQEVSHGNEQKNRSRNCAHNRNQSRRCGLGLPGITSAVGLAAIGIVTGIGVTHEDSRMRRM